MSVLRAQVDTARRRLGKAAYPSRLLDRMAAAGIRAAAVDKRVHVAVTPPRVGNIGDQAMVESFAVNVDEPIVLVDREPERQLRPVRAAGGVRVVTLASLLYGLGPAHLRDVRAFLRLVAGARSLSVFGADTMDGAYNVRASVMRSRCAELAARAGVPARVLGFSWNAAPHPAALRALRRADRAGVVLMARDPASAARLRSHGLQHVVDVADLVFSDPTVDHEIGDALRAKMTSRPVVLVNASGMIGSWFDQVPDYRALVQHLLDRGYDVVLVPHVLRDSADDVTMGQQVAEGFPAERVRAIAAPLWSPAQIRGLASRAHLIVTGRMHLAIIGLSQRVPVVAMSTQGKVAGLLGLFGLDDFCIDPRPGMGTSIIAAVDRVHGDHDQIVSGIGERLQDVRRLSRRNVQGLTTDDDPGEG